MSIRTSTAIMKAVFICAIFSFTAHSQANRPPVFVVHLGDNPQVISSGKPVTFKVSAYDPEGKPVTFTWKRDDALAKSGPDTSYTTVFVGPYGEVHKVVCVASDPEGLQDSVMFLFVLTHVADGWGSTPKSILLEQNYPNPFNPSTTISFVLPTAANVSLTVYDALGQHVATLVNRKMDAGSYHVQWTPHTSSGIFLYRLQAGSYTRTLKMLLLK
jgi:hypothetical protein